MIRHHRLPVWGQSLACDLANWQQNNKIHQFVIKIAAQNELDITEKSFYNWMDNVKRMDLKSTRADSISEREALL